MKRAIPLAVACVAVLVAAAGQVQAAFIISNFPQANDSNFSTISGSSGNFSKAAGFTLPAGHDYSLDSVDLRLTRNDAGATMQLDLFADVGGNPAGSPLVSFNIPSFSGTGNVTFTTVTPFTLLASTTYWLAATGTSPTAVGINWLGSSPRITPTGIATSAGYRFNSSGTYPPVTSSGIFNTYQINGSAITAVPEPSSLAMLGIGGGVMGIVCIRRRRGERKQAATP